MQPVKHLFFDLDHTLWDFNSNSKSTFQHIFDHHNVGVDMTDFIPVYEPINAKYWQLFRHNKISKEDLRYARLKEAFDVLKYKANDDLISVLSEDYIQNLANYNQLFPNTIEILSELKPFYQLHIITNGFKEVQAKKMKSSNIDHFFETLTTSDDAGCKKPNPDIFAYALNLAQAKKVESLMIGDNIEADVEGAQKFGINAVLFGKDDTFDGHQITCLSELKTILK
ncbi:MAG: YjjG family noncanonical pyrimidine nucleotidase [Psychroflexus halocasei]|uniref:YjjG family noncanonical pyrimidine nucleotidase n=1 Tax=Psychroflexus sp. S27 TaxID=1982757 RepID=UPI000C29B8A0|nr:YjjG family noncanonical pyrimidine nucleotidase [Psychroflexus sp. S27]PJX21858.1 noncanonical pyrimidine nucleotidase, YjjG family [Psychroflexus sp. S27]